VRLDGPDVRVVAVSRFRETDPVGYADQPRFLNAACLVETDLSARELLERLLAVERSLGRERAGPRFGPRTIDLDLLLYGDETIDEPGLTVPHPRLAERRFVLEPLAELDHDLTLPDGRRVVHLL
jgi:2-amino-4-hydroxy-6-hydroxymethyldihydropteridine diphosphokinase